MPIAKIQLPDGRIGRFDVPEGTTEAEVMLFAEKQFAQTTEVEPPAQQPPPVQEQPDNIITPGVLGGPETLDQPAVIRPDAANIQAGLTIASGAVAEPIAGLAGVAGAILPGEEGQGKEFVEKTREALTIAPGSPEAVGKLQAVGEVLEPVAKLMKGAETGLGDAVFKATNSPALAAAATTIPTIIAELTGVAAGKVVAKSAARLKNLKAQGKIAQEITDAAPDVDTLKQTSRALYDEIDKTGAVIKQDAYTGLSKKIAAETKKAGLDPDITPKANKAVQRVAELEGQPVSVTDVDTLRKVAGNAAKSIEPAESALGSKIINNIDEFLDNAGPKQLDVPNKKDIPEIGKKYKIARDLWGRAKKSELLSESFTKARNQATGFENGLRTQFRGILNNTKKRKFFNKQEIAAMERVVQGGTGENIAKLIGRFGFSEGGAKNVVGASLGIAGGAAVGGVPGAVIVPLIGQVSRKLAQRMTRGNAEFADQVIRAGKNAEKITAAYLKNTPPASRTAQELSELLMKQDIDVNVLQNTDLIIDAKNIIAKNRKLIASSVAGEQVVSEAVEQ